MGKVAVIIVTWNAGKLLDRCLDNLNRQSLKPHRIIVIDNGSNDAELPILKSPPDSIQVVLLENNTGFAAANNLGVAMAADCEWIVLLNPDAFPEPNWLQLLIDAAKNNPKISVFASCLIDANRPDILDGAGDIYHVSGIAKRRFHGKSLSINPVCNELVFGPCGAAAMYRQSVFSKVGGFDESFFCYFEDVDLAFRLQLKGYKCLYVPLAKVMHVGSGTTSKQSDFSVYYGQRNLLWAFFKNMPGLLLCMFLPLHLIANGLAFIICLIRGQGLVWITARHASIKGLKTILKKRKAIQKGKVVSNYVLLRSMTFSLLSWLS